MKIDLHVHTSENSRCGKLSAKETIQRYKDAGYDAIVLTDHFSIFSINYWAEKGRKDFSAAYHEAQEDAVRFGKETGLLVLNGYELRFFGSDNDYLVYGMPRDLADDYENLLNRKVADFSELAVKHDFLFYQAHPFRDGITIVKPEYLFGMEVKNGNARARNRNDIAGLWADRYQLHKIAGSDCHRAEDVGITGIETAETVRDMNDLLRVLRNNLYRIL